MLFHDNSAASQRSRILRHLQSTGPLTTLQARHHLDVMHPGMRICELRKRGYAIETVWVDDTTPEGFSHRVGKYLLKPRRQLTIVDFLAQKQNPEQAATGSGQWVKHSSGVNNTSCDTSEQEQFRGGSIT